MVGSSDVPSGSARGPLVLAVPVKSLFLSLCSFMPFDMIGNTCEAIDTLLGQKEVRLRHPRAPVALTVAFPPRPLPTQASTGDRCEGSTIGSV